MIGRGQNIVRSRSSVVVACMIIAIWLVMALIDPVIQSWLGSGATDLDLAAGLKPPLSQTKEGVPLLLGSDQLGRNVAAGIVHGARVSFVIAFFSVALSVLIGLLMGGLSGFYGDQGVRRNLVQVFAWIVALGGTLYYVGDIISHGISVYSLVPAVILMLIGYVIDRLASSLKMKTYGIPFDLLIQRISEIQESIPGLFLILALVSVVAQPTYFTIALVIAVLFWNQIARLSRAEILAIREEDYMRSVRAAGLSDLRMVTRHVLPNILPSLIVIIAFQFSSAILLESSLSFLGVGTMVEDVSWGKILNEARRFPEAWWLAVFPGLAIFLVLYALNNLGDYFAQYQRRNDRNVGFSWYLHHK